MLRFLQTLRRLPYYRMELDNVLLGIVEAQLSLKDLQKEVARLRIVVHTPPFGDDPDRWAFKQNALDRLEASTVHSGG